MLRPRRREWSAGKSGAKPLRDKIAAKWGGAYGLGIKYAKTMFGASEGGH